MRKPQRTLVHVILGKWRLGLLSRKPRFDPWVRKIPWRRKWLPTSVFLPGESAGQRSLMGYTFPGVSGCILKVIPVTKAS